MKSKGEKRLFGLFKKKTTPAPTAPPPSEPVEEKNRSAVSVTELGTTTDSVCTVSTIPLEDPMPPRKGSIAQTSVIHYSPPGTIRAAFPPSVTSSVVSDGSDESGTVVITRKSNIVLDDEESVISTPVSQYDESPIVQKTRTKRVAPPPPPVPTSPVSPVFIASPIQPTSSSSFSASPAPRNQQHFRQESTNSINSTGGPPPPPPHKKQENETDYEDLLKKLQTKFEEWHQVRLENEGSIKEGKLKAEVLQEHEKLRALLENQITSDRPLNDSSSNNNEKNAKNHNFKQKTPLKIPQYGNFYAQPPSSPSPPARVGAVPGGTVYQKITSREKSSSPSISNSSSVQITNGKSVSPKTDENRNEVISKKKISTTTAQNTEAIDRLRREVEEQIQREKEVKQYRNPKNLGIQVKSPESKKKDLPPQPQSLQKSSVGPRMIEYKPMKSPGLPLEPEDIYEEINDIAPPIPNTPPPKLSEYRREQQSSAPRMPTGPANGYVRLQMNGAAKKSAPSAPVSFTHQVAKTVYTGPEYASSPKLSRKTPDQTKPGKIYSSVPVKEEKKVCEKPQLHPQTANGSEPISNEFLQAQGGMIAATSSSSSQNQNNRLNPPMARGASVDQNGYGYSTKQTIPNNTSSVRIISSVEKQGSPAPSRSADYRKLPSMTRTVSDDQNNCEYASKTTINIATSPYTQRKAETPTSSLSNYKKIQASPMANGQSVTSRGTSSPLNYRKISAPLTAKPQSSVPLRSLSTETTQSPPTNRRSYGPSGILSATSSRTIITSATSPPYPKGSTGPTVITAKSDVPSVPISAKMFSPEGSFDISEVLKGPKLRKVGMPVERSGISLGKVVDAEPSNRPSATPPPPPPPPPPGVMRSPVLQQAAPKNPELRDSLMSEIREAGRLRAARAAQSA